MKGRVASRPIIDMSWFMSNGLLYVQIFNAYNAKRARDKLTDFEFFKLILSSRHLATLTAWHHHYHTIKQTQIAHCVKKITGHLIDREVISNTQINSSNSSSVVTQLSLFPLVLLKIRLKKDRAYWKLTFFMTWELSHVQKKNKRYVLRVSLCSVFVPLCIIM